MCTIDARAWTPGVESLNARLGVNRIVEIIMSCLLSGQPMECVWLRVVWCEMWPGACLVATNERAAALALRCMVLHQCHASLERGGD